MSFSDSKRDIAEELLEIAIRTSKVVDFLPSGLEAILRCAQGSVAVLATAESGKWRAVRRLAEGDLARIAHGATFKRP